MLRYALARVEMARYVLHHLTQETSHGLGNPVSVIDGPGVSPGMTADMLVLFDTGESSAICFVGDDAADAEVEAAIERLHCVDSALLRRLDIGMRSTSGQDGRLVIIAAGAGNKKHCAMCEDADVVYRCVGYSSDDLAALRWLNG